MGSLSEPDPNGVLPRAGATPTNALPSFLGGTAAKVADLYEAAWTVNSLLDLLAGRIRWLHLEPQGADGLGVEFYRVLPSGAREYHSVKRQVPGSASAWTPSQFTRNVLSSGRNILEDLFSHLAEDETATAVFVSQDAAGVMRELAERARATTDADAFRHVLSDDHRREFDERIAPPSPSAAHSMLRRCQFETIGHRLLVQAVEDRIPALIQRADGKPADPADVRRLLSEFAWQRLGQAMSVDDIVIELDRQGYAEQPLAASAQIRARITERNGGFQSRIRRTLINGAHIPRDQVAGIVDAITTGAESLLLAGRAGEGKSSVVAQVLDRLNEAGVPYLALPMDELDGVISSVELGGRYGLSASPAVVLGEMSAGNPAVLCIDQLDALSFVSGRNVRGHQLLEDLIQQASRYPELRLLLACRSFDLEHDDTLRSLVSGQSSTARQVNIELLTDEDVQDAIAAASLTDLVLSDSQVELLRTPLHLFLFLGVNEPRGDFGQRRDLFNRYWEEKLRRVDESAGNGAFARAAERLSAVLSDRRQLQAPRTLLTGHEAALDAMASEGVVILDESRLSFFHASFFDDVFARGFVSRGEDLVDWLKAAGQGLFRRSQVRQMFEYLRDDDPDPYLRTLSRLLGDDSIRFHLKRFTLDWIGQLEDPREVEWSLLEEQNESLQRHILSAMRNRVPWFDLLDSLGISHSWLTSDAEEDRNRAVYLLRAPKILQFRSAEAAHLFRELVGGSESDQQRLLVAMSFGDTYHSREMMDLFLDLIDDGTLDQARGFGVNADWWLVLYGVSTARPDYCSEAIGHWLDRRYTLAEQRGSNGLDESSQRSRFSEDVIKRAVEGAPLAFAHELLPRVARAAIGPDQGSWRHPFGLCGQIVEGLTTALSHLAEDDPTSLDSLFDGLPTDPAIVAEQIRLGAWAANSDRYADQILGRLLEREELLSISGIGPAVGAGTNLGSPGLSSELERLVLDHAPKAERGQWYDHSQFRLLSNFATHALSDRGKKRLGELRRKFGVERLSDAPIVPRVTWGAVPPRIPDAAAARMTDAEWIHAMQTLQVRRAGDRDWDQARLSWQLGIRTKTEPERFARLAAVEMPDELPPRYFSTVLEALAEVDRDAVALGGILAVIRRLHALPEQPCGLAIGRAVRAIVIEQVPPDIIEAVAFYATLDPDPGGDEWMKLDLGEDNVLDQAITAGISSVRGVAAEAIASLLFADAGRIGQLRDAIERLVRDPVLAVRALAVRPLLAILRDDESRSIELFRILCADADPVLGTQYIEEYLHWAIYRSYASVRSIIIEMLNSPELSARQAAARQICLAALEDGESQEAAMADAALVEGGDSEMRAAAAQIYAQNCGQPDVAEQCIAGVSRFFDDPEDRVRMAAARCFHELEADRLSEHGDLIEAFSTSAAFTDDPSALLYRLREMRRPLPASVCSLAERAVDAWGPEAADISTSLSADGNALSKLIVRFYAQTTDDTQRKRALDAIDRMLEVGFLGIDDELRAADRG